MKIVLAVVLTFVIGFVVGGYAPRAELERTKKELAEAREAAERRGEAAGWASGLSQMLAARPAMPEPARPARAETAPVPAPNLPPAPDLAPREETPDGGEERDSEGESFDGVRAAALIRAAKFRQAFLDEVNLDAARTTAFDGIIRDMNTEVAREAERVRQKLDAVSGRPSVRSFVDSAVDLAQVYQRADDKLQRLLSPEEREVAARKRFDLTSQVDIEAFRAVVEKMSKLERRAPDAPAEED